MCAIGTYQPNTGQSTCINCPAGYLCATTNLQAPTDCPTGKYCPAKTNAGSYAGSVDCPAGTYGDRINIGGASTNCIPCPPGKWCSAGLTAKSQAQDCAATFFCPYGSTAANGYSNTYEFGKAASGLCPPGYTCAAGTTAPTPCAVGTFQVAAGSTACNQCTAGYYCDEKGMSVLNVDQ